MHEMSLAENVLQVIEQEAVRQGFARVRTVWLELGQLACVEPDALTFSFDQVKKGSLAESARLEIVKIEGRGWCHHCACAVRLPAWYEPCPECGSYGVEVTGGGQFRVKELEVE